ncbi:hypothetical protein [Lentzea sp.]|uniref:hypothetical protein n=1 Tax=Lentzea sp. TaxID=56099 RepID=UPI002C95130B|nr:hypothetical protein [Lentzea sp.]HUQ54044.1 hypothetical protein [Lentzea sp.]
MLNVFVGSAEQQLAVVDAFVAAAAALGLEAREHEAASDREIDAVLVGPDGPTLFVQLKSAATVAADTVTRQLRQRPENLRDDMTYVVVADRITAAARESLSRAGVNWLDLRGHLRLRAPGLFIDADVPAQVRPKAERRGISGQVGVELSALLLLDPARTLGVRAAAEELSRSPSSVSEAFAALRAAGLVDGENRVTGSELFWELAEHWRPVSRDLAGIPGPGGGWDDRDTAALRLGLDDVESTVGWALTDTVAAVAYGAPVSTRVDHPPDFYVSDQSILRRAVQLLGVAATASSRAGRVRVAPISLVCTRRVDATGWADQIWPLANPLFVALDLAQDPGRGREILDGWTPGKPWHRVW